jgi:ParB family chromosome partitioning protein
MVAQPEGASTTMVAISLIDPDAENMRAEVGDVTELAQSIRELGVLQPVLLRRMPGGRYGMVAGHRRLAGAIEAGLVELPALLLGEVSDDMRDLMMLVENLQREDLSPVEEARGYQRVLARGGVGGQSGLARKIGRSQGHISKRLMLLSLPNEALSAIEAGTLTVADASRLVPLAAWPERVSAVLATAQRYPGASIASEARRQQQEAEQAAQLAAQVDQLRAAGVPEVAEGIALSESNGPCPLGWLGITDDQHAGLPCHAWRVGHRGLVMLCTDPATHGGGEDEEGQPPSVITVAEPSWVAEQRRRQAAREAERARRDASSARRLAFAVELVRRSEDCAPGFSARMWLLGAGGDSQLPLATIARVLGQEGTDAGAEDDRAVGDTAVIVESLFGSDSLRHAERVLYATALAVGEGIATGWLDTDEDMAATRLYLAHLSAAGFAFSEDEDEIAAKIAEQELEAVTTAVGEEAANA